MDLLGSYFTQFTFCTQIEKMKFFVQHFKSFDWKWWKIVQLKVNHLKGNVYF